ncbi:Structural maintenance of chromosomes protein 6 [Pleurostoma richardsiae]|uniref:Structural maintenance of chromosomes protein 6 n=1 Tax=Pleurostoma richardsiae TaxID=41990 RepID=A0AA38VIY0_9PEZI|nr:Structural maintenance of chromosomes protein 6 [Pleurostoma richardsiae]
MPGRTVNNIGTSSRKRARHADGDVPAEHQQAGSGIDAVSSQPRDMTRRKRVRISATGSNGGDSGVSPRQSHDLDTDDDGEDNDGEAAVVDGERYEEPSATQYEILRDAGFSHLEHEDEDDQRATQRIRRKNQKTQQEQRQNQQYGDNSVSENGILESITCIYFMCHERLHCELGPLLNFIVGENGSGKSAILTAITLCLGGKASSTNRGGSLKSFIKEGRDQAILTVKIKNQGADAYQPDLYGDSIIVERHFSRAGSSGFKLKSTMGKVISTKKSEVDEMVEYYCLQVDNPLNVLSQDNARQFLNAASAAQKYKYFIQGVQLEQLDNDYRVIIEYLESNEQKEEDLQARVDAAKSAWEKAKRLQELVDKHKDMRARRRLYTRQLIWAQVSDQERALEAQNAALVAADDDIADAEQVATEKSQVFDEAEEKLGRAHAAFETVREEEAAIAEKVEVANDQFSEARKELEKIHADERDVQQRLVLASERVTGIKDKIHAEEQRLETSTGDALVRKQEELAAARRRDEQLVAEIEDSTRSLPELEKRHANSQDEVKKTNTAIEQKRNEIMSVENRVRNLEQGRGSPYDAYEPNMAQLVRMIENDQGFLQKPVGPVGAHVQLLKPQWSSVIEKTFGGTLNGFIVTSKRDQYRLQGMMQRLKIQRSPILIANGHSINTNGKEPDQEFDTILRVLKFDNQLVRDQMILSHAIEQVVLIADRTDAERVMVDGPAPRNVTACLCLHDTRRGYGLRLTARPSRTGVSLSTSPIAPFEGRLRLKTDSGSQIAMLQDNLQQLADELRELDNEKRRLQQMVQRYRSELADHKKKAGVLDRGLREVRVDINTIQEELDAFDGADGRLQTLHEELETATVEKDHYGSQWGTMVVTKAEQNKRVQELKKELQKAKTEMADYQHRLSKAEHKVARCEDARRIALTEKNQACDEIEIRKDEKRRIEHRRQRQAEQVREFTEQAAAHEPERVHIGEGESYSSVEKKLEAVNKSLAERERRIGMTDEQVFDSARVTQQAYQESQKALEQTRKENQALKITINNRLERWRKFQRYISATSRANFIYLLSERGFRGKLLLDHKKHLLQVQVEPDQTRKGAGGRNTKTLSGGEKSFSSICLLLAIWEAMGSPLRCLDEFDVFMDNVNRAISTNMLISAARRSVGRQYIMITPNAIEGRAKLDKDVKIIRLTDPRQRLLADH